MDKGLPTELLQEIFSYIPLSKVFRYTRLCKRIHSCLNSSDFARISLQRTTLPRRMNSVCETAEDKLWLYWPRECQKVYAIDILAPLDSLDWNGGSIMSGKPMPPSIGLLIQLKELRMAQTCLFGPIPDELWELAQLLTLDLSFNRLNCTISNEIQNLNALIRLDISNSGLVGFIPTTIRYLENLRYLNFAHNSLEGFIPNEFGCLTRLENLYLDSNKLCGEIPGSICRLTSLAVLSVARNNLIGSISVLCKIKSLRHANLSDNKFCGPIPMEIGNLPELSVLNISGNQLSSGLPPSLFHSTSLVILDLSRNSLYGCIPEDINRMLRPDASLKILKLNDNNLRGRIPSALKLNSKRRLLNLDVSGNSKLDYKLSCICNII